MLTYIILEEYSRGSGAYYPHLKIRVTNFAEASKILDDFNLSDVNYLEKIPRHLEPIVVTDDLNLTLRFRQAFDLNELKKWCGVTIDPKSDRSFYFNGSNQYSNYSDEIILNIERMFNKEIVRAEMIAGVDTYIVDDGYTRGLSDSTYNEGWRVEKYDVKDGRILEKYDWWQNLSDYWKTVFKRNCRKGYCCLNVPNLEMLGHIEEITELKLLQEYSRIEDSLPSITYGEILNLSPLMKLTKLKKLDLQGIKFDDAQLIFSLKSLKELNISLSNITDLKGIENLESLENLDISFTKIESILPLYILENLEILNCSHTKIKVLTPLKKIKSINLQSTNFSLADIKNFQKLLGYPIQELKFK